MQKNWIMEQKWQELLFIHYGMDPKLIKDCLPFELDLFDNQAIISVVPFRMSGIRFPYMPALPWISNLLELNIRTYVKVNGVRGVYFFTLETDSKLSEYIANKFFHLPYRYSKISLKLESQNYVFEHARDNLSFKLSATIGDSRENSALDTWACERYSLFTFHKKQNYRGVVEHPAWIFQNLKIKNLDNSFTKMITSENLSMLGASYCSGFKVRFYPFEKIQI